MEEDPHHPAELDAKVGGRFKLTALLQKRIRELVAGAPRLVEIRSDNPIDVAIAEVRAGKVGLVPRRRGVAAARRSHRPGGLPMARIVLGVCGSIAAYKAVDLTSKLVQAGHEVDVLLTPMAERFVRPLSFAALTRTARCSRATRGPTATRRGCRTRPSTPSSSWWPPPPPT